MGWSNCGTDSRNRRIGYAVSAQCDHKGCKARIHRGLAYACGGMHGEGNIKNDNHGCEGYFCGEHLDYVEDEGGEVYALCPTCAKALQDAEEARDQADALSALSPQLGQGEG